jgi:hypothetical protein
MENVMKNKKLPAFRDTAKAAAIAAQELKNDASLATFTFILESRKGYMAEGFYPNVTMKQYKAVVMALEGKFDDTDLDALNVPKIILPPGVK